MPDITQDSVVVASSSQVSSDLAGQTVLLSLVDAKYYGFSDVAGRIWSLVQSPTSARTVSRAIADEYEMALETIERDVLTFLRAAAAKGLIDVVSGE